MYVCMSVCPSHNQIIRLNEKENLIENLLRIESRTFEVEDNHAIHRANGISISLNENLAMLTKIKKLGPLQPKCHEFDSWARQC